MSESSGSSIGDVVVGIVGIVVTAVIGTLASIATHNIWGKVSTSKYRIRGFKADQRVNIDGTPNNTFDKTEAQHQAHEEGRTGRPKRKKNKP